MDAEGGFEEPTQFPYNPARVLAQAQLTGLADLRNLFRDRKIKSIEHLYESTHAQWTKARAAWEQSKKTRQRDFSYITRVEKHLRSNFNTMI